MQPISFANFYPFIFEMEKKCDQVKCLEHVVQKDAPEEFVRGFELVSFTTLTSGQVRNFENNLYFNVV